jgi:hypothetical protein
VVLEKPIIFLGVSRSGTTIISEIIFQHQALAWPSNYQTRYPDKVWVNKIRPLLDNNIWSLRGQKPQLNKIPFYNKYAFKPDEAYNFWNYITGPEINFSRNFLLNQKATSRDKERIRKIFEKLVTYQNRKRLAFKITGPGRVSYLHSIFPDAIFIQINREPWANIRSLLKVPFWKERGMHQLWWQGAYSDLERQRAMDLKDRPALLTAMQYCKIRKKTVEEAEKNNVILHSFSYEDFIRNPKDVLSQILSITNLSNSPFIDKYLIRNKIFNRNISSSDFFSNEDELIMREMLKDYL